MSVQPGAGKLSGAGFAAPKRFRTVTKLAAPDAASRSITTRSERSSPYGMRIWYWMKPRGPYTRFQAPIMSSGWKYSGIDCSSASRCLGTLRTVSYTHLTLPTNREV